MSSMSITLSKTSRATTPPPHGNHQVPGTGPTNSSLQSVSLISADSYINIPIVTHLERRRFIFEQSDLIVPIHKLFKDYLCLKPAKAIDFSGWILPGPFFSLIFRSTKFCTDISFEDTIGVSENAFYALKGLPKVRRVNLKNAITFNDISSKVIASWSLLIELNISCCPVTMDGFKILPLACTGLKTLIAQSCPGLDDFCMISIADCVQIHRKLSVIDLSKNSDFNDEGALILIDQGSNVISSLNLSACRRLTSLPMAGLRKKTTSLKHLDISQLNLGTTAFEWLPEGCVFIESLNLSKCSNVSNESMQFLGRRCQHLKNLNVSKCVNISDQGIEFFLERFEGSLQKIDLSGCVQCSGPTAMMLCGKQGQTLRDIRLNGLSQIDADSLCALLTACKDLTHFEISADLRSACTHRKSMVPHINDKVLVKAKYSKLEFVMIQGASMVTDIGALSLVSKCKNLHTLDVNNVSGVSDALLHSLGSACSNLKYFSISGNGKITDNGIISLTSGCNNLTHLDVSSCFRLTDYGIKSLHKCPDLEYLNIRSVDQVTDISLRILSRFCFKLKFIDISNLYLVTKQAAVDLCNRCPELTVFNCTSCNIIANELASAVRHSLPFAQTRGKCRLEARPKPVSSFNRYVLDMKQDEMQCRKIQRLARYFLRNLNLRNIAHSLSHAVRDVQRLIRGFLGRRRYHRIRMATDKTYRSATNLQRQLKKLFLIHLTRKKDRYWRIHNESTVLVQRTFRGHASRKRTNIRKRYQLKIYMKIRRLAMIYVAVRGARTTHKCIISVQKFMRARPFQSRYKIIIQGFRKLIVAAKIFLATRRALNLFSEQFFNKGADFIIASHKITRWAKAVIHNYSIVQFVLLCGKVFWNDCELKKWNQEIKERHASKIQKIFRNYAWKLKRAYEKAHIIRFNAATLTVQRAWRRYAAMKWYVNWRRHKKLQAARWRRFYKGKWAKLLGLYAAKIQKAQRGKIFLRNRAAAAFTLQRVERGRVGRALARKKIELLRNYKATIIQETWRRHRARLWRKGQMAIEHMSSRRIQKAERRRQLLKARLRLAKEALAEKERQIRAEKKRLVEARKQQVLSYSM